MSLVHAVTLTTELEKARLLRDLQRAPLKDKAGRELYVAVHRVKKQKKPLKQKGLFYAWITILADHIGCSVEDMKQDLKAEFLPRVERVNRVTGEITLEVKSTESLDIEEWSRFLTQIDELAQRHFGVLLPSPNHPSAWEAARRHQAA